MARTVRSVTGLDRPGAVTPPGRSPTATAPGRPRLHVLPDAPNRPPEDGGDGGEHSGRLPASTLPGLGWLPPALGRAATGAAREAVATAATVVSVQLNLVAAALPATGADREAPAAPPVPTSPATPVVLVHGFGSSEASWFAFRRALRADGRTVMTFNYSPRAQSVEELADRLTETVADLLADTGAEKVHLIGHSLGGLVIAQALTARRLADSVDLVVTLGSPFGGSPWAELLPVGPLVRAMRAGSPLLRRLAATPPPAAARWLAFASTLDAIVPAERAVPAHPLVTRLTVDAAGHSGMLLDPEVIARIVAAVSGPVPVPTPPGRPCSCRTTSPPRLRRLADPGTGERRRPELTAPLTDQAAESVAG